MRWVTRFTIAGVIAAVVLALIGGFATVALSVLAAATMVTRQNSLSRWEEKYASFDSHTSP